MGAWDTIPRLCIVGKLPTQCGASQSRSSHAPYTSGPNPAWTVSGMPGFVRPLAQFARDQRESLCRSFAFILLLEPVRLASKRSSPQICEQARLLKAGACQHTMTCSSAVVPADRLRSDGRGRAGLGGGRRPVDPLGFASAVRRACSALADPVIFCVSANSIARRTGPSSPLPR